MPSDGKIFLTQVEGEMMNKRLQRRVIFGFSLLLLPILCASAQTIPTRRVEIKSVQTGATGTSGFMSIRGKELKGNNIQIGKQGAFFTFEPAGGGWYYITISIGGEGYVDVAGGKNEDGINVGTWEKNGKDNQKFRLKYLGQGRFKIYTFGGRVVCAQDTSAKDGTNIHTWKDHNRPSTEWYLIKEGKELYNPYEGNLKDALSAQNNAYFTEADPTQFSLENAGKIMQAHINGLNSATDQWPAILGMVQAIAKNDQTPARFAMYGAIADANILKASNVAEKVLKATVLAKIKEATASEDDKMVMAAIEAINEKM